MNGKRQRHEGQMSPTEMHILQNTRFIELTKALKAAKDRQDTKAVDEILEKLQKLEESRSDETKDWGYGL